MKSAKKNSNHLAAGEIPTGARWLKQRDKIGSPTHRKTRQRSKVLGRRSRVSKETCKMVVSPRRNPVRDQPYEAQIDYHNLPIKPRQLQRKLKEHTKEVSGTSRHI